MIAALDRVFLRVARFDSPNDEPRLGRYGKAAGLLIIFTGGFAVNATVAATNTFRRCLAVC
jgi:hypothetical protein